MNNVIMKMCEMVLENTLQSQKPSRKRYGATVHPPFLCIRQDASFIRQGSVEYLACYGDAAKTPPNK